MKTTVIAVLAMLLFFSVIFNIVTEVNLRKTVKEWADEKDKTLEWKNKFEGLQAIKFPITKVETFVTEPVVLKNKISFSDYVSMDESTMQRIIFEDLAKNLVDEFMSNPNYVRIDLEENLMFCHKTYISTIRLVPFREEMEK